MKEELKFSIAIGAKNIKDHPLLSTTQKGQLIKMFRLTNPDLKTNPESASLEDTWIQIEQEQNCQFFTAFLFKENQVISLICGTLEGENIFIRNAFTLNAYRGQGCLKSVVYNLISALSEYSKEKKYLYIVVETRVPCSRYKELTEQVLDELNEEIKKFQCKIDIEPEKLLINLNSRLYAIPQNSNITDDAIKLRTYGPYLTSALLALNHHKSGDMLFDNLTITPPVSYKVTRSFLDKSVQYSFPSSKIGYGLNINFSAEQQTNLNQEINLSISKTNFVFMPYLEINQVLVERVQVALEELNQHFNEKPPVNQPQQAKHITPITNWCHTSY